MNVSVIIPTLNEAATIESALRCLAGQGFAEIIVADGNSIDGTPDRAAAAGAVVISSQRGRAHQMNAGAQASSGSVLLFLHGDTGLPSRAVSRMLEVLRDPDVQGGAFYLRFDSPRLLMRLQSAASNLRSHVAVPYGDQAIFVRRGFFFETGGYREWPLMEDVDLAWRIKKRGALKLIRAAVVTSGRRYERHGFWRTIIRNQLLIAGFYAGVSPHRLARFYEYAR